MSTITVPHSDEDLAFPRAYSEAHGTSAEAFLARQARNLREHLPQPVRAEATAATGIIAPGTGRRGDAPRAPRSQARATVTLDINVLPDVFQARQPHQAASARVVGLVVGGTLAGVRPAHGLTALSSCLVLKLPWGTREKRGKSFGFRGASVDSVDLVEGNLAAGNPPRARYRSRFLHRLCPTYPQPFLTPGFRPGE